MIGASVLLLACALDLLIGDPLWIPHPVRFIGKGISLLERFLRRIVSSPADLRIAGIALVLIVVAGTYALTGYVVGLLRNLPVAAGTAGLVVLTATTIATRELLASVRRVVRSVRSGDLDGARKNVAMIVGRDTQALSERGVLKAGIESLAENLSDGVVAPLFYLALGGLPLAMAYKAVNTLDSMVGYRNERYLHFGWAGARLDDAANYLPARITGGMIVAAVWLATAARGAGKACDRAKRALVIMSRDGRKHPSPNSGIPEASMAGALGVRLGGPSTYGGVVLEKPFLGDGMSEDYRAASEQALTIATVSAVIAACGAAAALGMRGWM